jgi:hypothetical protein
MGKKLKKLMKAAALAGAAYLASKNMGAGTKEKTPIKDYLTKDHKFKAGDRNITCLIFLKNILTKLIL